MSKIVTYNSLGHYGRFCNGMFQIASTIGIARKNGFQYAFPKWCNYDHAERFGSKEDIDLQKYFINPLPLYRGPILKDRFIDWGYHDVKLTESISLSGHMQSRKYFDHCIDEVRYYFEMAGEFKKTGNVALHIRRTDYDNGYHPRLGLEYYEQAMNEFGSETIFTIFSDDRDDAIKMIKQASIGNRRIIFALGNDYIEDFKLMKSHTNFIIGNSSYSAMAAMLADAEKVIAPSPWFGPKYTNITGADIYCPEWKVINYEKKEALCA